MVIADEGGKVVRARRPSGEALRMLEAGGGGLVEETTGNNLSGNNLPGNSLPGNNLPGNSLSGNSLSGNNLPDKGVGNGLEEMVDDNKRLQVGMEELDKQWHCLRDTLQNLA